MQGTVAIADLYLYDGAGNPTWITGSATSSASGFTSMSLQTPTGTNLCPYCTGAPSVTGTPAGTLSLFGLDAQGTHATLNVSFLPPIARWNNPTLPISRLTN